MQWDEVDVEGAEVVCADPEGCGAEDFTRFQRMQGKANLEGLKWVRKLENTFGQVGFEEVETEVFEGQRSKTGLLQDLQSLVMQEEVGGRAEGGGERDERLAGNIESGLTKWVWGQKSLVEPRERIE